MMTATQGIPCPICGTTLAVSVTTNRNGKHAVGLHCPKDGRHIRAFINHRPFVEETIERTLAEAERQGKGLPTWATAPAPALQNDNGGPAPKAATKKRGRSA